MKRLYNINLNSFFSTYFPIHVDWCIFSKKDFKFLFSSLCKGKFEEIKVLQSSLKNCDLFSQDFVTSSTKYVKKKICFSIYHGKMTWHANRFEIFFGCYQFLKF